MKKILLVEPDFPFPNKSKNKANKIHKNFVPIGLLKFGAMYKSKGYKVKLVRGFKTEREIGFIPNRILVTSLFTYWSKYVWSSIDHYRSLFPNAEIWLGGIYATLHYNSKKMRSKAKKYNVKIKPGINEEAEKYLPDYRLIHKVDYHATHMMRGCIRKCKFCYTWKLEPDRINKTKNEIISELKKKKKNKVIFYDNNLLANPNIKEILNEFSNLRLNNKPVIFESQSGFDGRLLNSELAILLKKARFQNVRIAWDNGYNEKKSIKNQIDLLSKAGYRPKNISVFMIYNYDISFSEMVKKFNYCSRLGVQITDCRYRPFDWDHDDYNPHMRKGQPEGGYHINKESGWTDKKVRQFRKKVRRHNIEIRYARDKGKKYDNRMEKWSAIRSTYKILKLKKIPKMDSIYKSELIQKRIKRLNSLRNYHEKNGKNYPDLSSFKKDNDLDFYLKSFEEKINKIK